MGREIRRVPPDWKHPTDSEGNYKPLYDGAFAKAAQEWQEGYDAWQIEPQGDYPFEEWDGPAPNPEYYHPEWTEEEASCYQVYETVTEGTPTSPVFTSLDEMQAWLITQVTQGFSARATAEFIKTGWAPSMVFVPGRGVSGLGIHSLDFLADDEEEEEQCNPED